MSARTPYAAIVSAQQYVHSCLFDRIISGRYPGGTHLKTEDIAEELKTSRMPVREALRQLNAEGLVVIKPNRGAFVTSLTAADILELFEMRAALEGLACRVAARLRTGDDLERLDKLLVQMKRHQKTPTAWLRQHDLLHDAICAIARRPRLSRQISLLRDQTRPYIRLYISTHDDPEVAGIEHLTLVNAVRTGDSTRAEAEMRSHVERNGETIVAFLRSRRGEPAQKRALRAVMAS
jgi:DNA-binding GntR family transcriptional regulator